MLSVKVEAMPTYRIYEVQEESIIRKLQYFVEAESEDEAVEKAMNGEAGPIEHETIDGPGYVTWGWSARSTDTVEDDTAWEEAIADLEERRLL